MSPLFSPSRCCNRLLRLVLAVGILAAGACERQPTPLSPEEFAPRFAPGDPSFTVIVKDGVGVAVPNAFVRLVSKLGVSTDLITDNTGTASIALPTGDYCVSVRMTPPSIMGEPVIAPATIPSSLSQEVNGPPPLRTDVAPALFNKFGQIGFSASAWGDCLSKPPTKHNSSGTTLPVVLPASAQYTLPLVAPDGQSLFQITAGLQQVVGYVYTPVSTRHLAKGYQFLNDRNFIDGFLQFVSVADRPVDPAEVKALRFGVAPGQPFQMEFQQSVYDPTTQRTINLTATLYEQTAGEGGSENTLDMLVTEPLYCQQDYVTYPRLTKFVSSNIGFMGDPNPAVTVGSTDLRVLLIPNRTVVAMELVVKGGDSYAVTFREDLSSSSRLVTDVSFTCDASGNCGGASVKYSGGSGHVLFPFFRSLGDGMAKGTFFLTGLTDPNQQITWSAKSSGEGIPLASKKNTSAGFTPVAKVTGSSCVLQDSNDPKVFMGW